MHAQVLEVMWEDDVALCLTPQAFSNIQPSADIWNNINVQVSGDLGTSGLLVCRCLTAFT